MWVTFCDKTGQIICDETCLGAKVGTRTKISIARVQKKTHNCESLLVTFSRKFREAKKGITIWGVSIMSGYSIIEFLDDFF